MPKLQKMYLVVYLCAVAIQVIWFVCGMHFGTHRFQLYDSAHYLILSENLATHGAFSRAMQDPFFPDIARTPGYPFFLLVMQQMGASLTAISLFQCLLAATVPVLIFDLLRRHLRSIQFAIAAVVVLLIDLSVLLFSPYLLTDSLFYVGFAWLLWVLLRFSNTSTPHIGVQIILPALLTGCLVLIRPIALFLPILLVLWWVFQKKPLRVVLLGVLLVFALPGGWMTRNYNTFGVFTMSSMGPNNLLMFNAAGVQAHAEKRSFEAVQGEWMAAARSNFDWQNDPNATRNYMRWCRSEALRIFKNHPIATTRVYLENAASFFLKPPRGYFDVNFNLRSEYTPVSELGDRRSITARFGALRNDTSSIGLALTTLQFLLNLFQLAMATLGLAFLWKINRSWFYLLSTALLYFWFFSLFTQTDARFRLPVVPILIIASGFGFEKLATFRYRKAKAS